MCLESIHDSSCPYVEFCCTYDALNGGRSATLSDKLQAFDISPVRISGSSVLRDPGLVFCRRFMNLNNQGNGNITQGQFPDSIHQHNSSSLRDRDFPRSFSTSRRLLSTFRTAAIPAVSPSRNRMARPCSRGLLPATITSRRRTWRRTAMVLRAAQFIQPLHKLPSEPEHSDSDQPELRDQPGRDDSDWPRNWNRLPNLAGHSQCATTQRRKSLSGVDASIPEYRAWP